MTCLLAIPTDQAVLLADLPFVVGGSLSGGVSEVLRVVLVRGYAFLKIRAVLVVGVASLVFWWCW